MLCRVPPCLEIHRHQGVGLSFDQRNAINLFDLFQKGLLGRKLCLFPGPKLFFWQRNNDFAAFDRMVRRKETEWVSN